MESPAIELHASAAINRLLPLLLRNRLVHNQTSLEMWEWVQASAPAPMRQAQRPAATVNSTLFGH